jgi:AraC family transcriptional regulator
MQVTIVTFPETKVATVRHVGSPSQEHDTAGKLIAWKRQHGLLDHAIYRSYGLHYTNPRTVNQAEHRVDFCLSYDGRIDPNLYGVFEGISDDAVRYGSGRRVAPEQSGRVVSFRRVAPSQ